MCVQIFLSTNRNPYPCTDIPIRVQIYLDLPTPTKHGTAYVSTHSHSLVDGIQVQAIMLMLYHEMFCEMLLFLGDI